MRSFTNWTLALAAMMLGQTLAGPIRVHPGGPEDIVVTKYDTLNGTFVGGSKAVQDSTMATSSAAQLPISIVNNMAGSSAGQLNAYVIGQDSNKNVVLLASDGSWYYPPGTTSGVPVAITADLAQPLGAAGSTTTITLPDYVSAGRVYIADGTLQWFVVTNGAGGAALVEPSPVNPSDPNAGVNWGFIELTNTEAGGIYANLSYVDFVGLILGASLLTTDGSVQTAEGLSSDAVAQICAGLVAQTASDGYPWSSLCMTDSSGNYLRALAPYDYIQDNHADAWSNYFTDYINSVWSTYSSSPLTIAAAAGSYTCTTGGSDTLTCGGDNRGYAKPTAADIFGCNSGPFAIQAGDNSEHYAIVPILCAAFNRATLLLDGGNVQPGLPATDYYTVSPTNYYSKLVHHYEVDGKGYAFSYDDVNSSGENESGALIAANPQSLTITVGGPSSS
ncbi:putative glucan endo-1,3-beta-glucosidase precursor [Talaromyces proteolyticus]|uniref:Glucan endo-1,3-beta-glucosidase n=1 Tax=Talaromyces proteolyticus TaxID=1131652 RepID=A0AAD4PUH6_9EURO|nr:putative glucan endo-1,3-beta-glucosidase precursor [Talaromyces proteolyticus]KAH8690117.1 putative glucan endo-1,3-beta-glucosidase precursor [Talaromyces proteolyticus]